MATRFVIGPAGSGKTHHCVTSIAAAATDDPLGPLIFYVVPKQATFTAQRRLAAAAVGGGFARVRVVSFELLAEHILQECGGETVPAISGRGRRIILAHLLRELSDRLAVYQSSSNRIGLVTELDQTFRELEHNGHDSQSLAGLIESLAAEDPPDDSPQKQLIGKLHDVRLLYDAYQAFLGRDRIDAHRRLQQVMELIGECASLRDARVYIDGHLEFADFDRRLIVQLARVVSEMTITVLMDHAEGVLQDPKRHPDPSSPFHRTARAYRSLHRALCEAGIPLETPIVLPERAGLPAELEFVRRHSFRLTRNTPAQVPESRSISMVAAGNRRGEIRVAIDVARRWMRDGLRPREIAVLCRTMGSYHDLIEAGFNDAQIPFFADRRRPATHHPLLRLIRALLAAAGNRLSSSSFLAIVKSGLSGLTREEADDLENFAVDHNISGEAWIDERPWRFGTRIRAMADEAEEAEDTPKGPVTTSPVQEQLRRRVAVPVSRLREEAGDGKPQTVRALTTALFASLHAYGAPAAMATWIEEAQKAGQLELAAEHQQVWTEVAELADELVVLLGDEEISLADYSSLLEMSLARFDLAIIPPTLDQITVGEFERSRFDHYRGVILLGWSEGDFPAATGEASVVGDEERRELSRRSFELEADSRRRLLDESLLAYIAVSRATERLCITRAQAGDGREAVPPSPYWLELQRRLPHVDASTPLAAPATTLDLILEMARWARSDATAHGLAADAYQKFATRLPATKALEAEVQRAWGALSYDNSAWLKPQTIKSLLGTELNGSVSQLETFARCPYQHFARYTLELKPRPESEVTALELGSLYHQVLERLIETVVKDTAGWAASMPTVAAVESVVESLSATIRSAMVLSDGRITHLRRQAAQHCGGVVVQQYLTGAVGTMRPAAVELTFGPKSDDRLPALQLRTASGNTLRLRGKIDRVDIDPAAAAAAVIDYKTSGRTLKLVEVYHGLALQLLTYLLVVEANAAALSGKPLSPAGAFYVGVVRGVESFEHPSQAPLPGTPEFLSKTQMRGIFPAGRIGLFDPGLENGQKSNVVHFKLNKNGDIAKRGTDCVDESQFAAVLRHVKAKLLEFTDRILAGDIAVRPYRLGKESPCTRCDYRSLCRFSPTVDGYRHLTGLTHEGILDQLSRGTNDR